MKPCKRCKSTNYSYRGETSDGHCCSQCHDNLAVREPRPPVKTRVTLEPSDCGYIWRHIERGNPQIGE